MSKIKIGPFTFDILKINGNRLLLQWTEKCGTVKTRWVINNNKIGV